MTFDLCVIGHVTEDRIEIAGRAPQMQPGGTAYYAGIAAHRLDLRTAVLTKLQPHDRPLLADLEALRITVRCLPSPATTRFVNIYPDPETRVQRIDAVAAPFAPADLDVDARVYLLGALTRHEITTACVQALVRRGGRVALDVQGLLRDVDGDRVVPARNDALPALLAGIDVLKASRDEALFITGAHTVEAAARELAAAGPHEVLVTSGGRGALLYVDGRYFTIPAYPPPVVVDPTGCGDTFFAAYLARRLRGDAAERAGHFAAEVAAAKIAYHGAFRGLRPRGRRQTHPVDSGGRFFG